VVTNQAAHHAISAPLDNPIDPATSDVVVQYEVKLQKGLECGGAYIKLLTESDEGIQASEFSDKTPYSIMFGPDKCGSTNKVHLILRHKSPKTGEIEEKHLTAAPQPKISKTTALYTLHLKPSDQSYEIWINDKSAKAGKLDADFNPSFVPAPEIDDPADTKPEDWVDTAKITDPDATKPEDWDEDAPMEIPDEDATMPVGWLENEPATVPDPDATKPEEWDDEEDGDWIAPSVPNPKCEAAPGCGPWVRVSVFSSSPFVC
jgi:calnexin